MKQRLIIFGNGTLQAHSLKHLLSGDFIIGVDRAAYWLLRHGVTPDMAIGDFDSTTEEEFRHITRSISLVKTFKPEKNQTDMELAVTFAVTQKPAEVIIFGGTGTRLDHTLATVHFLSMLLTAHIPHHLIDTTSRISFIGQGKTVIKNASYKYISLLPYTKSISVSLTGFRYNVTRKIVMQGSGLGVSNELRGTRGTIHLFAGKAWVIESND